MIDLFDGNNVLLRELTNTFGHFAPKGINLRFLLNKTFVEGSVQMWVFDGANHNDRRRQIHPDYKMQREPLAENLYASISLWKEVLPYSGAFYVEVPEWEADDVISTLARSYASAGVKVRINSNDFDYVQLADVPNIVLNGPKELRFPAKFVPLYKALCGDASDNIPGVSGFGQKSWEDMRPHWDKLLRALERNSAQALVDLPWPSRVAKRMQAYFSEPENFEQFLGFLKIVKFYNVPIDLIEKHTVAGLRDYQSADAILGKFLL